LASIFLFDWVPTFWFGVGAILVIGSAWLYKQLLPPSKPSQPVGHHQQPLNNNIEMRPFLQNNENHQRHENHVDIKSETIVPRNVRRNNPPLSPQTNAVSPSGLFPQNQRSIEI